MKCASTICRNALTSPDLLEDRFFLQADGLNVFPGFQTTLENGFLQAYPKPGLAGQAWAGQGRVAALLQEGATLRVMAIGADKSAIAREISRIMGNATRVDIPAQMQQCAADKFQAAAAESQAPSGDFTPPPIGAW